MGIPIEFYLVPKIAKPVENIKIQKARITFDQFEPTCQSFDLKQDLMRPLRDFLSTDSKTAHRARVLCDSFDHPRLAVVSGSQTIPNVGVFPYHEISRVDPADANIYVLTENQIIHWTANDESTLDLTLLIMEKKPIVIQENAASLVIKC